ncbi:MAG: hypothetical protein ACLPYB_04630 [Desulfobaccales bacterium]
MDEQFDFDVGLDDQQPTKATRKGKQQNSTTPPPGYISISNNTPVVDNQQDIDRAAASARDLKSPLTDRELKFIELHLIQKLGKDDAMIQAGYGRFGQVWRCTLGSRILIKYESRASDRRILFREMGAGEVAICQGLLDLAQGARSEQVRRAAWADLASCMGLKSEQIESFQGVTLNVYSQGEAERLGIVTKKEVGGPPPGPQRIQITK